MRQIFFAISLTVSLVFGGVSRAAPPGESGPQILTVEWRQERLSVDAKEVPLAEVLAVVSARTGLQVRGLALLKGKANVHFIGLDLPGGIKALLPDINYALAAGGGAAGYALSITSDHSPEALAETAAAHAREDTPEALAGAGYVPESYKKLYHWAHHGDLTALREAATDGDAATQAIALKLLAKQRPDQAAEVAASAVHSPEPGRRLNGVQALRELNSPVSVGALGAALEDPDIGVRQAAVLGLMGQTSPEAIRWLGQALRDSEASIRLLALQLLAEKGADGASSVGIALQSPDPVLREKARQVLEQISAAE